MGRRRRGNRVDGWLVIDKPLGITSSAVVNKARWAYRAQKAGHAGTLDPLATGMLAIAFGEATKTIPIAQEAEKTYRFSVGLGAATTTDDLEGEVIERSESRPTDADIVAALPDFTGDIQQVPPQFSAVKVDGNRAYDIARGGETVSLGARPLHVARLDLIDRPDADTATFEMVCGKGGYVRSIARDLGAALGCYGHVTMLRRIASGGFSVEDAMPFDALDGVREAEHGPLLPLDAALSGLPRIVMTGAAAARLRNGNPVPNETGQVAEGAEALVVEGETAIALVTCSDGLLRPHRVFVPG